MCIAIQVDTVVYTTVVVLLPKDIRCRIIDDQSIKKNCYFTSMHNKSHLVSHFHKY